MAPPPTKKPQRGDIILVRRQPLLSQEPRSGEIIKEDRNRRAENGRQKAEGE
jgi:hypothetical protein